MLRSSISSMGRAIVGVRLQSWQRGHRMSVGSSCALHLQPDIAMRMSQRRAHSTAAGPPVGGNENGQSPFDDYDIVGFDLDATLLRYNIGEMVPLVYRCLQRFLVEEKQYPRSMLELPFDGGFMQKGLIVDDVHGNIIKLSWDAEIVRASHGTRALSAAQIADCYGPTRQWPTATQFSANPLSTWNTPLEKQIRALLDCFDMAAALNFAQAVDAIDAKRTHQHRQPPPYLVWRDVLDGLLHIYARDNFSNGCSAYFRALRDDTARYVLTDNGDTVALLQQLRGRGKSLFLLTGSNVDFANLTASHAFNTTAWPNLFDLVVCYARKPGFFNDSRPYLCVDALREVPGSEVPLDAKLQLNRIYTQGNWRQLRDALAEKLGKCGDAVRCLYVGDNLVQDVYTPVTGHQVDSVAVHEDLHPETVASVSRWGSYFCVDNKPTLWASIIAKYSRGCVPRVSAMADPVGPQGRPQCDGHSPRTP